MRSIKNWRAHGCVAFGAVLSVALAACGGGGDSTGDGEVLTPTFTMKGDGTVLRALNIQATITGLNGHTPRCALVGGRLPAGVTLTRGCALTGVPTEAGVFQYDVELGAQDVSNELVFKETLQVFGPSVSYAYLNGGYNLGDAVDAKPDVSRQWTKGPGETLSYALSQGKLPGGVSIDPATGRVSGTAAPEGTYAFRVSATVKSSAGTAVVTQDSNSQIVVGPLKVSYASGNYQGIHARVGEAFSAPVSGVPPGSFTFAWAAGVTPPAGVMLDPATGTISGTVQAPLDASYNVAVTGTVGGQSVKGTAIAHIVASQY